MDVLWPMMQIVGSVIVILLGAWIVLGILRGMWTTLTGQNVAPERKDDVEDRTITRGPDGGKLMQVYCNEHGGTFFAGGTRFQEWCPVCGKWTRVR